MKIPPGSAAITAHLTVKDIQTAMDFYEKAFGFQRAFTLPGPGGRIMHGEMTYQGCKLMLGPESAHTGVKAPSSYPSAPPVTMYVYTDDVDALCEKVKPLGARVLVPPANMFFGDRTCVLMDPDGHQWMFATHQKDVSAEDMNAAMGRHGGRHMDGADG